MDESRFQEDLLHKRWIYLSGSINANEAARMGKLIVWLNARSEAEITLYISSSGGEVDAGLDIYDIIKDSRAPVKAKVYLMANSSAVIVLQACRPRIALPDCQILLHRMKVKEDVEAWMEDPTIMEKHKRTVQRVYEILAKETGNAVETIRQKCKENMPMTAEEALKFGLVDEVLSW